MFARTMGRLRLHLQRRLRGRGTADGGFSLIELVLATGVLAMVMSSLAFLGTSAFTDAAVARNRQTATGLANQALEQVRALPYDTVSQGLLTSDLEAGTDPLVTATDGVYKYNGETIPNHTNTAAVDPLVPHRTTKTIDNTDYSVAAYVTYLGDDATSRSFRVTAYVSWTSGLRAGVNKFVQAQTIVYSPVGTPGCGSTATHPFAAPCQPFLYGTSDISEGGITIAPYSGSTGISCLSLDKAALWLPTESTNMQLEQIESVASSARTSGVELSGADGSNTLLGRQVVTAGSDSDPSQPKPEYDTQTVGTDATVQTSATASLGGCSNSLQVTSSGGDTASATATVLSSALHACANSADPPTNMLDSLPCGNAVATQGGSMRAQLNLNGLGNAILASVAGTPGSAADTNFDASPQTASCTSTAGDGCIHAGHRAALGSLRIGGLMSGLTGLAPLGFDYLVKLDGFSRTAAAEAGVGNADPSVSSTGTIQYWNGLSYTSLAIGPGSSVNIPLASVTLTNALAATTISLSGSLRTGTTTAAACASPCGDATAQAESPIIGDIRYTVIVAGVTLADLAIHIDLGTVAAHAEYTSGA
jgi:type II secretory pathway pseudopilin PulG